MKILFISPPSKNTLFPPLGIAYITALLNRNGHDAIIKEGNNKTFRELVGAVKTINPDVVGITMNTTTRFACLKLAEEIKSRYGVPVILGGPHPTLMADQILKNYSFVDYIIRNEGEYTCLKLLNTFEKKDDVGEIKGISYREKDRVIHNERAEPIIDLDALPYPELKFFDLMKYAKYPGQPKELFPYPTGSIISSRGCPYKCTFCSTSQFWGHKIRFRGAESVVGEMECMYSQYNTRYIVFNDDNFTSDKKRVIEICKLIIQKELNKKITWSCRSEVNVIDEEILSWLKQANCNLIEYGIEDGSPEGLKFFKKAHTMKEVFNAFKLTHESGIKAKGFFIIGGDYEKTETIIQKKILIEKLNPPMVVASILLAYPETEIFKKGEVNGWWDDTIWLKPCVGEKFHNYTPIYPGKNISFSELFSAVADINYWWSKKKGYVSFKDMVNIFFDLIKKRDFKKIYFMGKKIIVKNLKDKLIPPRHPKNKK